MPWAMIDMSKVRHVWVHKLAGDACPAAEERIRVYVSPEYYENAGTPVCETCGDDLMYSHTEIDLPVTFTPGEQPLIKALMALGWKPPKCYAPG